MTLRPSFPALASLLLAVFAPAVLHAADAPSPAELRMREQLRTVMLQLRTSETEKATLQATQQEMEQKNTALTTQVEAMTTQIATDKETNEKTVTGLKTIVDERDGEIGRLRESLEKWKSAHKDVVTTATKIEAQRAKLAGNVILLNRQVADQQTKNAAMYKIGTEVLNRYEKFGLGDALTAREPFIGITRVKFENLIQDFQDQLKDEQIKPATPPAAAAPADKKEKKDARPSTSATTSKPKAASTSAAKAPERQPAS